MSFTNQEERQLLAHLENKGNPHVLTPSQIGIKNSDDIVEGKTNKYALPYTMPANIKQNLIDFGFIPADFNTANMSTTQVFDLLFKIVSTR